MTDKKQPRKKCFIIMPITTPDHMTEAYDGDTNHFEHVLEYIFRPAIEAANLEPISPIAKGSEQINSRIIQNIEKADLVLCDMSTLNANVFFELGIRTALNKPICIIKDDKLNSKNVPFDIATINHHTYKSSIQLWNNAEEINKLTTHIKESIEHSNANELWKHFSMSASAHSLEKSEGDDKINYLVNLVEALRAENRQEQNQIGITNTIKYSHDPYEGHQNIIFRSPPKIGTETINKAILGLITSYIHNHSIEKDKIVEYLPEIRAEVIDKLITKFRYTAEHATKLVDKSFRQMIKLSIDFAP